MSRQRDELEKENNRLRRELDAMQEDYLLIKAQYAHAQGIIGTLIAINNRFYKKRIRYSTFDGDNYMTGK